MPHSGQKLPVFTEPHAQVQLSISGFFAPQLEQNFPVSVEPHAQVQLSAEGSLDFASASI